MRYITPALSRRQPLHLRHSFFPDLRIPRPLADEIGALKIFPGLLPLPLPVELHALGWTSRKRHALLAMIRDPAPNYRRHDAREHEDGDQITDIYGREPYRLEIQAPVRHQNTQCSEIEKIKSGQASVRHVTKGRL